MGSTNDETQRLLIPVLLILVVVLVPMLWIALTERTGVSTGILLGIMIAIILATWGGREALVPCVRRVIHSSTLTDLDGHIEALEAELNLRKGRCTKEPNKALVENYTALLRKARECRKLGDESTGWRCFVQARLLGLGLLEESDDIKSQGEIVLWKSKKRLSSWQLDDVKALLQKSLQENSVKDALSLQDLVAANTILEEQLDDNYESLRRAAGQLYVMIATACASLALLALLVPRLSGDITFDDNLPLVTVVIAVGALGGAVGGFGCVLSLFSKQEGVLYEQALNSWLVTVRPLVGATLAFIAALFLFSEILTFGTLSLEMLIAVCFVAGFSEELVLGVVRKMAGEPSSK